MLNVELFVPGSPLDAGRNPLHPKRNSVRTHC